MYFSHKHFLSLTIDENETKWSIFSFPIIIIVGGTNLSPINIIRFGMGRSTLTPTCTNLLNSTSERDSSHPCLISTWPKEGVYHIVCTVHPSIKQGWEGVYHSVCTVHPSIRQGWEESLPNVRLNKFVRVGARVNTAHPKANNT